MKSIILKIIVLVFVVVSVTSCDDFLNINTDPNNPTSVPLNQLLPSLQVDMAGALGTGSGGLSQVTMTYMHQIVQRGVILNDYGLNGDEFGVATPWTVLYTRTLMDIEQVINQGTEQGAAHYVGVAQISKAYLYSIMVDTWGDVPFTEATKAPEILNPVYDPGENVYPQLFALLDEGMANLTQPSTLSPGNDDFFYGGDLDLWRKFAKTVKLKMYSQIRLVQDVSAEVDALLAEGDLIENEDEDFEFKYNSGVSPDNRNPGYVQEYAPGTAQYYVSPYFYEIMANMNTFDHYDYGGIINTTDPRIPYYFYNQIAEVSEDDSPENPCSYCYGYVDPNSGSFVVQVPELEGTGMVAIWAFSFNIDPNEGFDQSASQSLGGLYPYGGRYDDGAGGAANFNGNPGVPQRLLTYYARKFIEAELYLTGEATGDARAAFEEALRASFSKVDQIAASASAPELDSDDVDDYVDAVLTAYDAASADGKLEHIITQKWIASFGWGPDVYTDYRRTGYPVLYDGNTDDIPFTIRAKDFPYSFPWSTANLSVNSNAPDQKVITSTDAKPFWMN
jgi:hypothetical protein